MSTITKLSFKSVARRSMMKTALKTTIKANPLDICSSQYPESCCTTCTASWLQYKDEGKSFRLTGS